MERLKMRLKTGPLLRTKNAAFQKRKVLEVETTTIELLSETKEIREVITALLMIVHKYGDFAYNLWLQSGGR